jgi:hypothetical protein
MGSAILETFRVVPPLQDVLVQTGDVSLRCVSKGFKSAFDEGLDRVWTNLKGQASTDLKFLAIFMNNIDEGNPPQEHALAFFKGLKDSLKKQELVYLSPSIRLPSNIACFELLGPKYIQDAIPEEIQKTAFKIDQLVVALENIPGFLESVPETYECPMTKEIMAIPVVDSSHLCVQSLWKKVKDGTLTDMTDRRLFHALKKETIDIHVKIFTHQACPCCRHPFQKESFRVHAKLQNEILHVLEDHAARLHFVEVFVDCNVGQENSLGYRCESDWEHTVRFRWTSQGWNGFVRTGTQFKLVTIKRRRSPEVKWEKREGYRMIPMELKERSIKITDMPSFAN